MFSRRLSGAVVAIAMTVALANCQESPATSSVESTEPIVVAAYNVENWLTMQRGSQPATKPDDEKAATVEVIAAVAPDILGVIEMGSEEEFADLQARLKAKGLEYADSEYVQAADPDRHVTLLSKFPIVERRSKTDVTFDMGGIARPMSRGILDVTIQINPQYQLRVLGVHFKSKRDVPEYDQAAMRAREALYLKNYSNRIIEKNPDVNLLLLGDFNDTRNEYPIRELLGGSGEKSLTALALADENGDVWTHFWGYADIYSRIDYLMVNKGLLPEIVAEKSGIDRTPGFATGSDHRAIHTAIIPENK